MQRTPVKQTPRSRPTPSPFPTASSSHLGKRGASEAGIDDTYTLQKSNRELQNRIETLERRNSSFEAREVKSGKELQELKDENAVLRQNRASLVDKSTADGSLSESRAKALQEDNARLTAELSTMRMRTSRTKDENEILHSEISQLNNKVSNLEQIAKPIQALEDEIKDLRAQNQELHSWRARAQNLGIQLEEEKRKSKSTQQENKDAEADRKGDDMYKQEINRQAHFISSSRTKISQLEVENAQLKESNTKWVDDVRAHDAREQELRDEIRILNGQLEAARREMDSVTQSFPSGETPTDPIAILQARLAALSKLHQEASTKSANQEIKIIELYARLTQATSAAEVTIAQMSKEKTDLERSLRWANEGRGAAEKAEKRAKEELRVYLEDHDTGSHQMPGGLGSSDQSARIRQLEHLVKEYKAELESHSRDSRDIEEKISKGQGLVKQSVLDEAQSQITSLQSRITSFESTLSELQNANTTLDAEVNDLMRRVASGEYNPKSERVIEFQNNPAAKIMAVRNQVLEDLRKENEALLRSGGGGGGGEGSVPRESWERLCKEKEELEKGHAKRLMRLKEIFSNKSKEFLEAVYSLLGWRIKFDESGTDIRLTSMYAPKGKMGLTLKFTSQEGHFGTMQMTGGMSRSEELGECRRFWIEERQSVPGFLAQVTTEMFEKTTMGQKAGYVGLEC